MHIYIYCINLRLVQSLKLIRWIIYPVFHFNFRRDVHKVVSQKLSIKAQHTERLQDCLMIVYCMQSGDLFAEHCSSRLTVSTFRYLLCRLLCLLLPCCSCLYTITQASKTLYNLEIEILKCGNFMFLFSRGQGCIRLTNCLTRFWDIFQVFYYDS